MTIREMLIADEGKVLTNGEIYGKTVYLGDGDSAENYHEIDEAEYENILAMQEAEAMEGRDKWNGQ